MCEVCVVGNDQVKLYWRVMNESNERDVTEMKDVPCHS